MRHNNQLPDNLPQLQNLIKRDPESYKDDFIQQFRHYESVLEIFKLTPDQENKSLESLVMFLAQVAQCYPEHLKIFPQQLVDLLRIHSINLDPEMRNCFCRALILLRNKQLILALDLLELFFQLLNCQDKNLREFLRDHIINDIKNMNAKHKDMKLNSTLQNFMFTQLKNANPKAAKMSVDVMVELYKKNVWNDAKTVNVIATVGCFSKYTKVMVASLKFFLGHDKDDEDEDDSNDDGEEPDLRSALMANKVNKKTKKRKKQLDSAKKLYVKAQKKKSKAPVFNFSAVHMIHNPQGMAEDLFRQVQNTNERFEVKLMHLDVISRLIGIHELFLFSFYPYIQRFIQPHQRQVTRILQFAAQAAHELVPSEIIEPLIKTLVNNFVTERNSSDVMAIGLNASREICSRCPLAMTEDLLQDLALYKNYKEKSVVMAARSLIMLYREQLPDLLHKKDRGRPTEATIEIKPKKYGEILAAETIPGAEVLLQAASEIDLNKTHKRGQKRKYDDSDAENSDSDFSDWEDVEHSDGSVNQTNDSDGDDSNDEDDESIEVPSGKIIDEKEAAKEIALTRIFTDEDFKRIEAELIKKKVTNARKKPIETQKQEFVKLDDIEMIYKKRRTDKQSRIEGMLKGREGRVKYGYKDGRLNIHCSKTNREQKKNKAFTMIRHKARSKVKKSFRDKQIKLRKHLIQQKKMK